ncbi:xyloglucan-specific galacturonosyltransferase 1-like [Chenopodium quinoa]|uniref:xyloglucan-specific galacturonosyltransferase 1-like n=1 Tax=Chenopodium quinoa TaxID=63459 RepID=UPI000B77DC7F|nr:xyloglucan-specific galacturonosyltransferase 1-like [Chenopodium quinoa]
MTVLNVKKKPLYEADDRGFQLDSCLFKFVKKFFVVFLVSLFLMFMWSSSTIIISSSIAHVCVTSRKLSSHYCLSAGAQSINYDIPVYNNTSTISYIERGTNVSKAEFSQFTYLDLVDKDKAMERANSRKVVEAQLAILRSYIVKSRPPSDNCEGRGIYVYDLPPKFNKDLVAKCNEIMPWLDFCKYFANDAMGEPILELGNSWYNTHQFSLEPIFHKRILKHPCRVDKAEEAKLFYVPFYGALDMLWSHFSPVKVPSNESQGAQARFYALSKDIVEWLKQQKMWKRHFGLDHVFVLGKNSWDLRRSEYLHWGTPLLELDELQNPIKLIIERHPWHMNDVGVPYPTYLHPRSDKEIVAWQEKIRQVPRKYLVSFAGAPRKDPTSIRSSLIEQCTSALGVCKFLNCGEKLCVESAPVVKLFMESEFCLQPDGDSPTRKSVFDSLIAGCIPVVFDPFTAHYQYPWHLPEDHNKYSVFIDQEEVKASKVNVVEKLVNIPLKQRQEMRKNIINELMPRLVYANANAKLEKFEDAFTIAVNNALQMTISRLT